MLSDAGALYTTPDKGRASHLMFQQPQGMPQKETMPKIQIPNPGLLAESPGLWSLRVLG